MRSLIALAAIALVAGLMSCDNQNADEIPLEELSVENASRLRAAVASNTDTTAMDDWQEIEVAALPEAVTTYITDNHGGEDIDEVFLTNEGEYVVLLENDLVLVFDAQGAFLVSYELDDYDCDHQRVEVPIESLAQAVQQYIATNYANETIEKAWVNSDGETVVRLSNRLRVVFDADGNFIEERRKNRRGDEDDWEEVEATALPQVVLDYISANHANDPIGEAFINSDNGEILVILDSDTGLLFDSDGNHLRTFDYDDHDEDDDWEEIALADLPQAITDYVAANYPGIDMEEAYFSDEEQEYAVELANDVILIFDADGNFIEEYDEEDDDDYRRVKNSDLPQAIKDYIATNYANETIRGAVFSEDDQEFIVFLTNRIMVIFDADGNFIEEDEYDEDVRDRKHWEEIETSELPQAALDYVAANYASKTLEQAFFNSKSNRYAVEFEDDTFVIFDADGNFIKEVRD